ncbi:MAG: serine--tRNA ligase [Rhizobiaceae bacterium MnEN-MB40S]|nr:MAG: serine--tRNA ligase [Rhizobiaceae bacterium MnEN-MB40S]
MLDIRWIRDNPEAFDKAMVQRSNETRSDALIALDEERRSHVQRMQEMQARRNSASKEIGAAMGRKETELAEKLKAEVAKLKGDLQQAEDEVRELDARMEESLLSVPNIPLEGVPVGADESANVEARAVGRKPGWNHPAKEHFEIGEALGQMDFETAARIAGSRFTIVSSQLARLERALGQFMLDLHTAEHGYTEVIPPLLVRSSALIGTGQLPKFAEDQFRTTDDRWMIPTAEVPLTNLVREQILEHDQLPLRYTALTPCFRSEAGSAGRDTRGMLRQHQFYKVELVSVTDEDNSVEELERMTACAEEVLKRLDLHYKVMVLSTGDMGFGARKTYDLEVWLPGQDTYREISSCSVCGDFQARRMHARYRKSGEKGASFVHTLNGSGVAVGRALIAVMENYLNEDGSITVPSALLPYTGGMTRVERN